MTKVHIRAQFSQVSLNPVVQFCKICLSNIIQYIIPKPIILRVQVCKLFCTNTWVFICIFLNQCIMQITMISLIIHIAVGCLLAPAAYGKPTPVNLLRQPGFKDCGENTYNCSFLARIFLSGIFSCPVFFCLAWNFILCLEMFYCLAFFPCLVLFA